MAFLSFFFFYIHKQKQIFSPILKNLLAYQSQVKNNWRALVNLLEKYEKFVNYFTVDEIAEDLLPLLIAYIVEGAAPVRQRACALVPCLSRAFNSNIKV